MALPPQMKCQHGPKVLATELSPEGSRAASSDSETSLKQKRSKGKNGANQNPVHDLNQVAWHANFTTHGKCGPKLTIHKLVSNTPEDLNVYTEITHAFGTVSHLFGVFCFEHVSASRLLATSTRLLQNLFGMCYF